MNDRPGPDLVTAIVAVFVGGVGVSIVTTLTAPILVSSAADNRTSYIGVYFALAAVGSLLGALFVCAIFGFDGQPTYARALAALLAGQGASALVVVATATGSNPSAALSFSVFGWVGFALSVFILMSAPSPRDEGTAEREYILPSGAVWTSEIEERRRRRT